MCRTLSNDMTHRGLFGDRNERGIRSRRPRKSTIDPAVGVKPAVILVGFCTTESSDHNLRSFSKLDIKSAKSFFLRFLNVLFVFVFV